MTTSLSDFERSLVVDLQTPFRSFRLLALEQILSRGASPGLVPILRELEAVETDEECRLLLSYVLDSLRETRGTDLPMTLPGTREAFLASFEAAPQRFRLHLLWRTPENQASMLADWGWERLAGETDGLVAAALVKTFARFWSRERLGQLLGVLSLAMSLRLRLAVVEAITRQAPDLLRPELPRLLETSDPRIRSLAVRALAALAPEEAFLHLEFSLLSGETAQKRSTLRDCLFLPFPFVRPILVKFLTVERDLELIKLAGVVVLNNPDPEVPFALTEILAHSPPEKVAVLEGMLKDLCQIIGKSGILNVPYDRYLARLQEFAHRKAAVRTVREFLSHLDDGEIADFSESASMLGGLTEKPFVAEVLREVPEWPLPEAVKTRLAEAQTGRTNRPEVSASVGATDFFRWETGVQVEWLFRLTPADREIVAPLLGRVLSTPTGSPQVRRMAVKTASRLGVRGFWDACFRLADEEEERLAAEALEYLDIEDHDRLVPYLGRFFRSAKERVRTKALVILGRYDPLQAVSTLMAVLQGSPPTERGQAFRIFVQFDFRLIREALAQFLETPLGRDFLGDGLLLFQANPDPGNLRLLYPLEQSLGGREGESVRRVFSETLRELIDWKLLSTEKAEELQREIREQWLAGEKRRRSSPPRVARPPRFPSPLPMTGVESDSPSRDRIIGVVVVAGLISLYLTLFGMPRLELPNRHPSGVPPSPTRGSGFVLPVGYGVGSASAVVLPKTTPEEQIGSRILQTRSAEPTIPRFVIPGSSR